ncbi:SCO7613 C-terminal domain-containing membrane protein [Microbacterium sp. NPDC057650]|uniref:SCO7613 C-terminal domain-containing membrane protein n=1 Tax=unclassified Microbacterium TaxID=2609290 RepID=UPI0036735FD2
MSATSERGIDWSEQAAAHLLDVNNCPVCASAQLIDGVCPNCAVDLTGQAGADLWAASVEAARVLRNRANLQRRVLLTSRRSAIRTPARLMQPGAGPVGAASLAVSESDSAAAPPTATAAAPVAVAGQAPPAAPPAPQMPQIPQMLAGESPAVSPGASLQSVLATAGAGLFAIAAIVFTFFNPDLADRTVRSLIIGLVTLVFLGGAWLLARRTLQSSAEAVGGLGLVFVGLDVQAVTGIAHTDAGAWISGAIATAVAGGLMLAAALRARIRIWLWASLLGLAVVPVMLGFAASDALAAALLIAVSGFAATGLCALLPRFAARFPAKQVEAPDAAVPASEGEPEAEPRRPLAFEAASLTTLQLIVTLLAIARIVFGGGSGFAAALVLAVLALHGVLAARQTLAQFWSLLGGALAAAAGAALAGSLLTELSPYERGEWIVAVVPAGAAIVLLLTALVPLPSRTSRSSLAGGAALALGVTSLPAVVTGLFIGRSLLQDMSGQPPAEVNPFLDAEPVLGAGTLPAVIGLAVVALGFVAFASCARPERGTERLRLPAHIVAVLYATGAVFTLACSGALPLAWSVGVVVVAAAVVGAALLTGPGRRSEAVRVLLIVAVHVALLVAVLLSWQDRTLVPPAGAAILIALAVIARSLPAEVRFLHVGAGYGYALALVATALSLAGITGIVQFSLTTSVGLLGAIVATFLTRIGARNWYAVLGVATAPFAIGVVQVLIERSGWTALSTGTMFALALVLLLTRRPGLTEPVRIVAAGLLVPTLAVVVVCLCAQLLVQSGSPVALPIIAVLVAVALASGPLVADLLVARGRDEQTADAARIAIEASALLTGGIAVFLALSREAAGLGTACLVLIVLGLGAALAAVVAGRRYGWWVSAAAFTGALWSAWALAGVELPEAYLLPPALGAAAVGILLTMRGRPAVGLFAAGMAVAVVPLDMLVAGAAASDDVPWRSSGLLAAGWVLLAATALVARSGAPRLRRLRVLRAPALGVAVVAMLAGTIQAVRWGTGRDAAPAEPSAIGVLLACAGLSALAALGIVIAARMLRDAASGPALTRFTASRWLYAPTALAFMVGVWPAIERDWSVIWAMWALMVAVLALMVFAASDRGGMLPPVWFLFGIAFVTAVVAWSPRDLRVEWFSLPLGAFLLAAGAHGLRGAPGADARLVDWPRGWQGSWPLLAPGLIVLWSASIVSTFTDPLTWRAILVMVLALAAILIGAARRLSAPFILGLIVLPVENVFVFAVQLGRGIESMPWWITLATIGAVLLIIAVAGERREGTGRGVVARMRDLR